VRSPSTALSARPLMTTVLMNARSNKSDSLRGAVANGPPRSPLHGRSSQTFKRKVRHGRARGRPAPHRSALRRPGARRSKTMSQLAFNLWIQQSRNGIVLGSRCRSALALGGSSIQYMMTSYSVAKRRKATSALKNEEYA
jgi:hypothetical protein